MLYLMLVLYWATVGTTSPLQRRAPTTANTATVNLANKTGSPEHLAAGFIYGIPDVLHQIPSHFYTEMGFNYGRAGGAQLPAPARGWIWGMSDYQGRFQSAYSNFLTTREYGGNFILLPHDLWGTDQSNSSTVWPGDDGNWTNYDQFVDTVLEDLKAYNMLEHVVWDTWNEPDGGYFWQRSEAQYLELWDRTVKRIRQVGDDTLAALQITGPSYAGSPSPSNPWWTGWLNEVKTNDTIPDYYSWHLEGGPDDPTQNIAENLPLLNSMLAEYGLPDRQININEYATFEEQVASASAWWIASLERQNILGLRGNWEEPGYALHDFMSNLLYKPWVDDSYTNWTKTGYWPNGDYQVYKYYASKMTGTRVGTDSSEDAKFDVYATIDGSNVKLLAGTRLVEGTYYIQVENLSSIGLPDSGILDVETWALIDDGHYAQVDGPVHKPTKSIVYSNDTVVIPVDQTAKAGNSAWAFEFQGA